MNTLILTILAFAGYPVTYRPNGKFLADNIFSIIAFILMYLSTRTGIKVPIRLFPIPGTEKITS